MEDDLIKKGILKVGNLEEGMIDTPGKANNAAKNVALTFIQIVVYTTVLIIIATIVYLRIEWHF